VRPGPDLPRRLLLYNVLLHDRYRRMFQGVRAMRDSTTYQYILEEGRQEGRQEGLAMGRVEEAQRTLLRQGRIRFGAPDGATETALRAITDLERLEGLLDRLVTVSGWQELLAAP
jgi:predicted transposase YdaD